MALQSTWMLLAWCARLAVAAVCLLAVLAAPAAAQRGVALVVGNSKYQHAAELKNPRNDAEDFSNALQRLEFKVIAGFDLDRRQLELKVREFSRAASDAKVVVFYYAGHGLQLSGRNYLVPVDARLEEADTVDLEAVKLEVVQQVMESRERTSLLFVDACRDNPLARNLARALGTRSSAVGRGLATMESGAGTLISFSTQPGNVALDGTGRNSPYAEALVREIARPGEDLSSVLISVRNSVMDATQRRQVPWEHSALRSRIYFASQPAIAATPPVSLIPLAQSEAERAWTIVQASEDADILDAYARQFPSTVYAALAKQRSASLREKASAKTASVVPPRQPAVVGQPKLAPPKSGPLKIGIAGPLTGPNAAFGAQIKTGAEAAAADFNARGGIIGRKIELVLGDDRSDPKQGVSVANKFVADGVSMVIGHFNSGVSIPASQVYAENGILMITPSASNPRLTEQGLWNVFRTTGRDDQQGWVAAAHVARQAGNSRVAVVHDGTTYGKGLADEFARAWAARQQPPPLVNEKVLVGDKDFSALVSKIKSADARFVYYGGLHTEAGLLVRQMRDLAVTATLISGDGIATDEFATIAGPAAEGTIMTFQPDARRRPGATDVVRRLRAKSIEPSGYMLYSYAALEVIAAGASKAQSADARSVAAAIGGGKFRTVLGELGFDKKGDLTETDHVIYIWRKGADGRITYVEEGRP